MPQKTFGVIIKVEAERFVKYRGVTNFKKLYIYLDNNFPKWRWGNVYHKRKQVGSFTQKNRIMRFS
jgi:hypothetical protein